MSTKQFYVTSYAVELITAQLRIIELFGLEVIISGVQIPKASPKPLCTKLFFAQVPCFRQTASFPRQGSFLKQTPTSSSSTTSCPNSPINSHTIYASQQSFLLGAELLIAGSQLLPPRSSQTSGAWLRSRLLAAEGMSISNLLIGFFPSRDTALCLHSLVGDARAGVGVQDMTWPLASWFLFIPEQKGGFLWSSA